MIGSLYSSDLSDTYYMTSEPWYDRIQNMGVTYHIKVVSSIQVNNGYNLPTINRLVDTKEERNTIIEGMYEGFLESIKENMLEYGHVLKSLNDNESLNFIINLTECDGCDMPKEIELSVPMSVILEYHNGAIFDIEAMDKIQLKVLEKN